MKDAIELLFPPDVPPILRWRLVVFAVCTSMLLFMSWALSPWGFALAESVEDLQNNVDDMRLSQIEQQMYDVKQSECLSTDHTARRFFGNRVLELARRYRQLAKEKVDIPPCPQGEPG